MATGGGAFKQYAQESNRASMFSQRPCIVQGDREPKIDSKV